MSKSFTRAEVAKHNKREDCWIIIENDVYNVTKFINLHPGGVAFLVEAAGTDSTESFRLYHHADVLTKYGPRFHVGTLADSDRVKTKRPVHLPGSFGDMIPYGDPSWYQRMKSPYYKATHIQFRARVREFVDKEILPTMSQWSEKDVPPHDIYKKMGEAGFLACMHGPPFPGKYLPASIKAPEGFDYFHELILFDEISRVGLTAVIGALTNGPSIGMSAIMRFASEEMKARVSPDVFLGARYIALAISEPNAGSDVANLRTHAVRDGADYIVNGCKKWITNGTYAHYFVTAVKTSNKGGHQGLSLMLLEKDMPGFTVRKVNIRGSDISGTALLEFENVRVPAKNLIGEENEGFKYIMHNFNHERFYISVCGARMSRVCVEECIKYALKRKTFGKTLSEQPVIRMKIAAMIRQVEQYQAWLELVTYQLCTMTHEEANLKMGDIICLLKAQMSKTFEYCARESVHIFGGNSMHAGGVGKRIEPMAASVKGYAIPAGAEDVMDDYGARAAFKMAKKMAKL
jgi:alkylation response protein AidB-like acyl-CoA dehydrogenase